MQKHSSLILKTVVCVGTIATMAFAGVESSPFLPILRFLLSFFGG